jgi:hypothetical protein
VPTAITSTLTLKVFSKGGSRTSSSPELSVLVVVDILRRSRGKLRPGNNKIVKKITNNTFLPIVYPLKKI